MPYTVHQGSSTHLLSLQEMVRVQRNEAAGCHWGRTPIYNAAQRASRAHPLCAPGLPLQCPLASAPRHQQHLWAAPGRVLLRRQGLSVTRPCTGPSHCGRKAMKRRHSMPLGAEVRADGRVRFRLWAPAAKQVELCLGDVILPMTALKGGWFELITDRAGAGSHYCFRINEDRRVPDPASRFQPYDVHGPSEVIDPRSFRWQDGGWKGRPWEETVIYELHVGAFTPEGRFSAVKDRLDYLVELGAIAIELMPVADFPGSRNWGYDGVLPFAPDACYGRPENLKDLVQTAHTKGLMVFLDVVYNHFGPEGNYLHTYAPQFFSQQRHTPWGGRSTSMGRAAVWYGISLSIMRSIGLRNITSTACGSMRSTLSSTIRTPISLPRSPKPFVKGRERRALFT